MAGAYWNGHDELAAWYSSGPASRKKQTNEIAHIVHWTLRSILRGIAVVQTVFLAPLPSLTRFISYLPLFPWRSLLLIITLTNIVTRT